MKNYKTLLLSLFIALLFSSCGDDENKTLDLNFNLKYNDEPLVFFEDYTYPDGRTIEFTRVSFYISEIAVEKGGSSRIIKDADYIDLTVSHSSLEDAQEGYAYSLDTESSEDFDAIAFNIGLTEQQNQTTPQEYPSSSALSLSGEYWSNWNSYVFVKIEGRSDIDNDGVSDGIALHLGSDMSMKHFRIDNVNSDQPVNISLDLAKVFKRDAEIFDITSTSRIHSLNQIPLIDWLMDNIENAFVFEQ